MLLVKTWLNKQKHNNSGIWRKEKEKKKFLKSSESLLNCSSSVSCNIYGKCYLVDKIHCEWPCNKFCDGNAKSLKKYPLSSIVKVKSRPKTNKKARDGDPKRWCSN